VEWERSGVVVEGEERASPSLGLVPLSCGCAN
jgi:hypothetical protein